MALSDILNRIESDTDAEVAEIVGEARDKALGLLEEAKTSATAASDRTAEEARQRAARERETMLANARLQARDRTVTARHELVERVLRRAVEALAELDDDRYAALIARNVAQAARGRETVRIADADSSRLAGKLPKAVKTALKDAGREAEISFDGAVADLPRGVLLESDRTSVEVSPRALVHEQREDLRGLVAAALFGEEA